MPDEQLSIGEVINLLRDDFPDVSVSKLRFLESQGLIDPDRSNSGYRQFGEGDIARLRFILQQQRDHFLPLKVIKSKLTLWERGEEDLGAGSGTPQSSNLDESGEPLSREDVLKRSNLSDDDLSALIDVGLLSPIDGSDVYPAEAGLIAVEARRLMEHGLEPRHLRSIRLAADRETDLLTQLVAPLLKASNSEARTRAKDTLESCSGSVRAIHRALLAVELRRQVT